MKPNVISIDNSPPWRLCIRLKPATVFIIGPGKKIKLTLTYPASTGRNFNEILRVIDSLQLTANFDVAPPVEWKNGEEVVISHTVSIEEAIAKIPKGFKEKKSYLRITPQPNK